MKILPPGLLAQALVLSNPEFVMAGSKSIQTTLFGLVSGKQSYSALVQWLQNNPDAAKTVSKALQPDDAPVSTAVPLPVGLVDALSAVWADLEAAAFPMASMENLCWTVQSGVIPSQEPVSPADGNWLLQPFPPVGKISFPSIGYTKDGPFAVRMLNNAPRHVCVYATFLSNQAPVTPAGWISRLSPDAPSEFETGTTKFLAVVNPNTPVSAISVGGSAQSVSFPISPNADSVRLVFGGLGIGRLDAVQSAAGIILTYVLDFAVPWIISRFPNADLRSATAWYQGLLADVAIRDAVMTSGAFIITSGATDIASLMDNLATNFTRIFLSDVLKPLRDAVDNQFGSLLESPEPSQKFASTLGWSAQIVAAMIRRSPPTQAWISQVNPTPAITLSASTSVELQVLITPDPQHLTWPFYMTAYSVTVGYGDSNGSFTQIQSAPTSAATAGSAISVLFGSVRNAGLFDISVSLMDGSGRQLSSGNLRLPGGNLSPANRTRSGSVVAREPRIVIGTNTGFVLSRTLSFKNGSYVWETNSLHTDSVGGNFAVNPQRLVGITLQEAAQSIGYVWNTTGEVIKSCCDGGMLTQAYLMQNVGTIVPDSPFKSMDCGFVLQPHLAYERSSAGAALGAAPGFFLDPRGPLPCLRQINFDAGPFDLGQTVSRGRFREGPLDSVAIHPSGYAIGVSSVNNRLEIVELSGSPVPDSAAPLSQIFGGPGQRAGLLLVPLAVAITASGFVLVLEQGNSRVQAFDIHGNCAAIFAGSPFLQLSTSSDAQYNDLAVSPSGYIYVLWSDAHGTAILDVYGADGKYLCRTSGVNAGKIAVDSRECVYTLNYTSIQRQNSPSEPAISVWTTSGR